MPIAELQDWLANQQWLQQAYEGVVVRSILSQFPSILSLPRATVAWTDLLCAASTLAQSRRGEHQEIALRVAQECLQDRSAARDEHDAAAIILDMLANRRAVELAPADEELGTLTSRLGVMARLQWTRRTFENSVQFNDGTVAPVNRFQGRFWEATEGAGWVSASAPTSAGKSFILLRRITEFVADRRTPTVVYVSPTRALVHEVELELRRLFHARKLRANITTLPLERSVREGVPNVLVYTQERLHLLLSRLRAPLIVDMLVVDEAQKVGDGKRGVLLQHAIERVLAANPNVQVAFVTPQTSNPEVLLADAPDGTEAVSVPSEDVTVNQNLIWVTQCPGDTRTWYAQVCSPRGVQDLGQLALPDRPSKVSMRLSLIAYEMGRLSTGNLVYANRPADAEKVALHLHALVGDVSPVDKELADLADLAKRTVHSRFNLAQYVLRGVAYHYGNMPFLLRSEIERLFRDGKIKFLACTSTLIEGVNLACRNVFLRGPTRGKEPMNDADFWNLAGRAGRWGRDRAGNIICIDPRDTYVWHGKSAPVVKLKQQITKATETVLASPDRIIEFIGTGTPRPLAGTDPALEHTTAYLMSLHLSGRGGAAATRWARRFDAATIDRIDRAAAAALEDFPVRPEIVARNPGISPLAMAQLLGLFRRRKKDPGELLPTTPEDNAAVDIYFRIFQRIGSTLTTQFANQNRTFALTLLIVHWMRGWPLPRLIQGQLDYQERNKISTNVPTTIRNVMREVEEVARFSAPKYLGCYVDVLRQHLQEINQDRLLAEAKDLQLLLEYGVSTETELSLLALGLSRTSAVNLSELMLNSTFDEAACLAWLDQNDPEDLDLPAAVRREIALIRELAVEA